MSPHIIRLFTQRYFIDKKEYIRQRTPSVRGTGYKSRLEDPDLSFEIGQKRIRERHTPPQTSASPPSSPVPQHFQQSRDTSSHATERHRTNITITQSYGNNLRLYKVLVLNGIRADRRIPAASPEAREKTPRMLSEVNVGFLGRGLETTAGCVRMSLVERSGSRSCLAGRRKVLEPPLWSLYGTFWLAGQISCHGSNIWNVGWICGVNCSSAGGITCGRTDW